ncbi:hypothetical protein CO172_01140 [Candidatus Uhrbacteria bacterium CG_4_9_14_3_um_filter_36_7]|uniref:Major facilitator superfamily (MFS) profile domain-containing protein n=1 Tax=Candidatus Uhrbacteria bacterium CG_4_9_14_3_um_filter_36_7 TaxID=1975033 RepID=A0A2M7XHZ2_9BACT|nr:MAG: hypothetical protein CO172_01140 [Candidatus Uhrbacteria bacterium CG_4_9_14_3_um_filter_36_7]
MKQFIPFWIFLLFFKIAAVLHYGAIAPLGERVLPLPMVGLLIGTASFIQTILDVPAGYLLDRYGYHRLLTLTTIVFILAGGMLLFPFNTPIYILSLLLASFGWLFFDPGINAYSLSWALKKQAGTFMSLRDVFCSIGGVIATILLGITLMFSPSILGGIITVSLLISLIFLYFAPKEKQSIQKQALKLPTHSHYIRRHTIFKTLGFIKQLNPASTMLLLLGFTSSTFYGMVWFVVPLLIARGSSAEIMSLGLGIFDFTVVLLGLFLGKLTDRTSKRRLVSVGLLLFTICAFLLSFQFGWFFLLFGFFATTGDEMASIALWSWLYTLNKEHAHDGLLAGTINLFHDFGWAVGPIMAGVLFPFIGPSFTLTTGALLLLFTWLIYKLLLQKYHSPLPNFAVPIKPHKNRCQI